MHFALNKTRTLPDIHRAFERLTQAVARGKLAPGEAESIFHLLEAESRPGKKQQWAPDLARVWRQQIG